MRNLLSYIACAGFTFGIGTLGVRLKQELCPSAPVVVIAPTAIAEPTEAAVRCEKEPKPPHGVKRLLDRNFPGWRFHPTSKEDCESVRAAGGKYAYAQMIVGDFDGDGHSDLAVLIDGDPDNISRPGVYIIAFLKRQDAYTMDTVTREGGGCLLLMPKGTNDFDYDAQREFTYVHDSIFSGEGMGGLSYLYENGKFRAIITSD